MKTEEKDVERGEEREERRVKTEEKGVQRGKGRENGGRQRRKG